jgi:hypothetical protein
MIPGERRRSALEFLTIGLLVASLVLLFIMFQGSQDQGREAAAANRALIRQNRQDLLIHAEASAARSCALAKELQYIALTVSANPSNAVVQTLNGFVDQACEVEQFPVRFPPGGPGPGPGTSSSTTSPPGTTPPPGTTTTPPPTTPPPSSPPPTPSPSPSPTCIPVIGCL